MKLACVRLVSTNRLNFRKYNQHVLINLYEFSSNCKCHLSSKDIFVRYICMAIINFRIPNAIRALLSGIINCSRLNCSQSRDCQCRKTDRSKANRENRNDEVDQPPCWYVEIVRRIGRELFARQIEYPSDWFVCRSRGCV